MIIILLLQNFFFGDYFYSINSDIKNFVLRTKNENELRYNLNSQKIINKDIVIVAIDEETLDRFGFPFSRKHYATIIENLNKAWAEVIGFDVIFANQNLDDIEWDNIFANSIKNAWNIVLWSALLAKDYDDLGIWVIEKPLEKFNDWALSYWYYQPNVDSITNVVTSFRPWSLRYTEKGKTEHFEYFGISVIKEIGRASCRERV